jgi:hypothetical protein
MSRGFIKGGGMDKFDAYLPLKHTFIHDSYCVSNQQNYFHNKVGYMYDPTGDRCSAHYGVDKKLWKISPHGITIDSVDVGRSDK